MVGIAQALTRRARNVAMHYAVPARAGAVYRDELTECLGERLHLHASDETRRIDFDALFASLAPDALAIVCGPLRMLEAARTAWNAQGRAPSDLRYETFGSSGLLPTEAFSVRVRGCDRVIDVPAATSMMDALNAAGAEVLSDCTRGECGVCAIDVVNVEGIIDHRDVFFSSHQKRENRKICPCVSRVIGTITVDLLYRPDVFEKKSIPQRLQSDF
jgi:vanillate O-demethylase ferredoxin subunit